MKITIDYDIQDFEVPAKVYDISGKHCFCLDELDQGTLKKLCDNFTKRVFNDAGTTLHPIEDLKVRTIEAWTGDRRSPRFQPLRVRSKKRATDKLAEIENIARARSIRLPLEHLTDELLSFVLNDFQLPK